LRGGHRSPLPGGRIHPPPPASLPAAVRLNDLSIVLPGNDQVQFAVLFARNVERDLVAHENRRDLRWFLAGSRSRKSNSRCFFRPHFASRPPSFSSFPGYPPRHLWLSTPRCGVPTANLGARVDLKSQRGGGGCFFAREGVTPPASVGTTRPFTRASCSPSKLIEQT
jgi:hypothetical protein